MRLGCEVSGENFPFWKKKKKATVSLFEICKADIFLSLLHKKSKGKKLFSLSYFCYMLYKVGDNFCSKCEIKNKKYYNSIGRFVSSSLKKIIKLKVMYHLLKFQMNLALYFVMFNISLEIKIERYNWLKFDKENRK